MKNTIIGFILGVIGTSIGAYLSHRFSEREGRRKEFNKAAVEFRCAFLPTIRALHGAYKTESVPDEKIYDVLVRTAVSQEQAIIKFREWLDFWQEIAFEKAWEEYCNPDGNSPEGRPFFSYRGSSKPDAKPLYDKEFVLNKIEALLSFAKPR